MISGMIRRIDPCGGHNIYESFRTQQRLFESDTRIKRTERIIEDNFRGILDLNGKVAGPDYYVNNNPETVWKEYLMFNLRHTFSLMANSDVSYLPGIASIAYRDCNFDKLNQDPEKIGKLINYVRLAKKEGKLITQDMSLDELTELYGPVLKQEEEIEDEKRHGLSLVRNKRYKIIRIDDFETAKHYGEFTGTGGGEGKLCYTENLAIWKNFMKNSWNYCYLCLRDDYNKIPPVKSKGYPKDDYGLSMIWVFVNPDGDISNSNVRWNHGDKTFSNVDNMFTKSELEELLGVRFEDVFRPNTEAAEKFMAKVKRAKERFKNGEPLQFIFDAVGTASCGFIPVCIDDKYNFIDAKGRFISKQWFTELREFFDKIAKVRLNNKWGFINTEGKILSGQLYDDVCDFSEGFGRVHLDDKWNFINEEGVLLLKQWVDVAYAFTEGQANILLNGKWNIIGKNGKIISKHWYDFIWSFVEGYAMVRKGNKYNFIEKNGSLLSEQWFDDARPFSEGYATVCLNNEWNYICKDGKMLSKQWFDSADSFEKGRGFIVIGQNGGYIYKTGQIYMW